MITAWQISSTMDKMQEFIRFIQQFDNQRGRLQKLLPCIQRIKRISEQKQSINRQLLQLQQTHMLNYTGATNITKTNQQQHNLPIQTNLNKKLLRLSQEISKCHSYNIKQIQKLKRQVDTKTIIQQKQLNQKRQQLLYQLNDCCACNERLMQQDSKLNFIDDRDRDRDQYNKKSQQYSPQQLKTIYSKYIDEWIRLAINNNIQLINVNNNNTNTNCNNNNYNHLSHPSSLTTTNTNNKITSQYTTQLYQLKCKLSSLKDKRRKQTVNKLFNCYNLNKNLNINTNAKQIIPVFNNNYSSNNRQANRKIQQVVTQKQQLSRQKKYQQQSNNSQSKGLFGSIMAMFSSTQYSDKNYNNNNKKAKQKQNQKHKQKINQKQRQLLLQHQKSQNTKQQQSPNNNNNYINPKQSNHHHNINQHNYIINPPSLHQIDDTEVRLRVAEIIAQIYQFREEINVMVWENVFGRLDGMVRNMELVNSEIRCYSQQLIRVGRFVVKQQQLGKNSGNMNKTIRNNNNTNNKTHMIQLLHKNPQLQFFTHFIKQNTNHRFNILSSIITTILPTLPTVNKFIQKRLIQFHQTCQQFQQTNRYKYGMKLKSTRSRKQFQIITKQMDQLQLYVGNSVLVRVKQLDKVLTQGLVVFLQGFRIIDIAQNPPHQQQPQQQTHQQVSPISQQQSSSPQLLLTSLKQQHQQQQQLSSSTAIIQSLLQYICMQQYQHQQQNQYHQYIYKQLQRQRHYHHHQSIQMLYDKLTASLLLSSLY